MRAVLQRVHSASVEVDAITCGKIDGGLLVYLGVSRDDSEHDLAYVVDKVRHLRVFEDDDGRMNLGVAEVGGQVLVVSAFTVQADARKGRRPSFEQAASQEQAVVWYERFCDALAATGLEIQRGQFGANMSVSAINAGPVCIMLDSRRTF